MAPSDGFWDGVGHGLSASPWWALLGALLVIGLIVIIAKYIVPSKERIKMRELDIREREAENDAARIESNRALAEQTRAMSESVHALSVQTAGKTAQITESTKNIGNDVLHIKEQTDETGLMVRDIHRRIVGGEGTD